MLRKPISMLPTFYPQNFASESLTGTVSGWQLKWPADGSGFGEFLSPVSDKAS